MSGEDCDALDRGDNDGQKPDKMFTLKKWNAVAMWSWDVECDTCAICRVQVMGNIQQPTLRPIPEHPDHGKQEKVCLRDLPQRPSNTYTPCVLAYNGCLTIL